MQSRFDRVDMLQKRQSNLLIIFSLFSQRQQYFRYNNLLFFESSTAMRRRSGAFHCESQQDYMQLAQAAHDHMGIFYDQKLNKQIMSQFKPSPSSPHSLDQYISNPQHSPSRFNEAFSGFQFQTQDEGEREEREQLQRPNLDLQRTIDIAIMCEDVHIASSKLRKESNINTASQKLDLDVAVERVGNKMIRFWLFNRKRVAEGDEILGLYLQRCSLTLNKDDGAKLTESNRKELESLILSSFATDFE